MPDAWDVVVVPFPYSERLAEKRRPALVLSNEALHRTGALWIAMITSAAAKTPRAGDVPIRDLGATGLPGPSLVRVSKVATVEPSRILRVAGRLPRDQRAAIAEAAHAFIAKP